MRGSVAKKKNRWYIYFYVGKEANGKWKKKWEGSWETKREAERALRTRLTELETAAEQPVSQYTVETFLYYWLENYCVPRLKPNTIKGYTTNTIKETYGCSIPVFQRPIEYSIRVAESPAAGKSILTYEPKNPAARSYRCLAEEVLHFE